MNLQKKSFPLHVHKVLVQKQDFLHKQADKAVIVQASQCQWKWNRQYNSNNITVKYVSCNMGKSETKRQTKGVMLIILGVLL